MPIRIDDVEPERRRAVEAAVNRAMALARRGTLSEGTLIEIATSEGLSDGELIHLRLGLIEMGLLSIRGERDVELGAGGSAVPEPLMRLIQRFVEGSAIEHGRLERLVALAGLSREAVSLLEKALDRNGITVRRTSGKPVPAPTARSIERLSAGADEVAKGPWPDSDLELEEEPPEESMGVFDPDLDEAVRAAREVIESDRFDPCPEKRVLTAEEEVGLSLLMRQGYDLSYELPEDFARNINPSEERVRAWNSMISHNTLLAYKMARTYVGRGLDPEDLEQHGMIGLMRGVRKFDASKGYKFSTYASWWIRQQITRAIANEGSLIRVPVHVHDMLAKLRQVEARITGQKGWASRHDLHLATGLDLTKIDLYRRLGRGAVSLDALVGDGVALADLIERPDDSIPSPEAALDAKFGRERIEGLLSLLGQREANILRARCGVIDGEVQTLDAIGVSLGVSRERVRQLERKALITLRDWANVEAVEPSPDDISKQFRFIHHNPTAVIEIAIRRAAAYKRAKELRHSHQPRQQRADKPALEGQQQIPEATPTTIETPPPRPTPPSFDPERPTAQSRPASRSHPSRRELAVLRRIEQGRNPVTSDSWDLAVTIYTLRKQGYIVLVSGDVERWQAQLTDIGKTLLASIARDSSPD